MNAQQRIERIWRWFKRRPSESLRNVLFAQYCGIVEREAYALGKRLPASVEIEDLQSDGAIGLLDAIDAYVPDKSSFTTFAPRRIRGQMLDGLRERDPLSRTTRQRIRRLEEAANQILVSTGENPTARQLAKQMNVTISEVSRQEQNAREGVMHSISGSRVMGDDRSIAADTLADPKQVDPSRRVIQNAVREAVTSGLTRAERLIVILYYYEGMTMAEIGLILDLSESRICQMHQSIMQRLKAKLSPRLLTV